MQFSCSMDQQGVWKDFPKVQRLDRPQLEHRNLERQEVLEDMSESLKHIFTLRFPKQKTRKCLLRRWKTKPMFVAQFGVGTLCMQKWIECLQCLPFILLKLVYFGMVCFHLYMSCWGSKVIKTLVIVFIRMFCLLDGFILLSLWKTKL